MTETTERQSPTISGNAQPCLWMSAGLVSYRLCDRDFDCERCPLDAALRGPAAREGAGALTGLAPNRDSGLAEPAALEALASAEETLETALHDLRHLRRRAALHLLAAETADVANVGPTLPDGGRLLTDLRAILGPRRYEELLRNLLG